MSRESDVNLIATMTFSAGAGIGLLAGGAPRVVALVALVPAVAVGLSLLGRFEPRARLGRRTTA